MKKGKAFGKRMVVLGALVVALSAAVFLNWKYASLDGSLDLSAALSGTTKYLGDAQYVNQPSTGATLATDFFSKTRNEREESRKKSIASLKEIVDDVKADEAAKKEASEQITQLTKNAESEVAIETLMKAKNFSDCVAVMTEEGINIVVKTSENGLLDSETLQIQDIVTSSTKIPLANIKIIEVK